MASERPNLDDEFQEADDGVIEDTAILQEIERERRDIPVADSVHVVLGDIAADTARDLQDEATRQRELAEKLVED